MAFISSASHVIFKVKSDSITILMGAPGETHSNIVVEGNGNHYGRYSMNGDSINHISIPLSKHKRNLLALYKATEASNGPVLFYGVKANNISPANLKTNATIESTGCSITCGFDAYTKEIPCGTGDWYDQRNAYPACCPLIARRLNIDYTLDSVSGRGIYRNWNDEDTAPVIGNVYPTANLDGHKAKPWNFSGKKQPDLVSISLGTNDLSNGDGKKNRKPFDVEKFTIKYISFANQIFERCFNKKIALLTNSMVSGANNHLLLECLKKIMAHIDIQHTVAIFEFVPMNQGGCDTHPDLKELQVMAD